MQEKKKGCASAEDYFKVGDFQDRLKNVNLKLKFALKAGKATAVLLSQAQTCSPG